MVDMPMVKCLVWDLDDTLWQGTLLEDEAVRPAAETVEVVRRLDARGILQSVASKNDHDHAWERLVEFGLAEFFVVPQIGWGAKSAAVRRIAERLNIAHDTIAFIDDQPAERAEVAFHFPDVRCYPAEQASAIPGLPEFSPRTVTVDSRKRRQLYQANFAREAERESFVGTNEEFLRSLDLDLSIRRADDAELSRAAELTLRTSQMNATGVHYPDSVLRELRTDSAHEVLIATLSDRFGSHGAIGLALLRIHARCWHLKLLATSCRVVSFGVGTAILNWLVDQAFHRGVHLVADFRATERNRMMDIAYRFAGLSDEVCECSASLPDEANLQRLHVVPEPRKVAGHIRLAAPTLGE